MLGYVKCEEGELLVKHQRLYSAIYCGLCHSLRKIGAFAVLPFFSYDFVFLAMLRMYVLGEKMELERDFCLFHPFRRKKQRLACNPTLKYCAWSALILIYEKMQDDRNDADSPLGHRLLIFLLLPIIRLEMKRAERKHGFPGELREKVAECLAQGRNLEKSGAELDAMCENFGFCLSFLLSFGTDGSEKRILEGVGDFLGRFIYTLDALDDREKDLESGAFNPIVLDGVLPDEKQLCRLDMVLSFYINEMKKILDLAEGEEALFALCDNVICKGLPGAVRKIILPKNGDENERSL